MERRKRFGKSAHLEVEGDGAMCGVGITKLPPNTVRRRHQQELKIRDKPKPDEVKEVVVAAGSKDDGMVQPAGEGKKLARHQQNLKSRDKPEPDEVKEMVSGAGSKEDGMVQPAGEGKKLKTLKLGKELIEYIRTREVMGILATEKPRPSLERIPQELFGRELKEQIAAEYEENREFDAYVLFQYRTKGYAQIQYFTDDEEV